MSAASFGPGDVGVRPRAPPAPGRTPGRCGAARPAASRPRRPAPSAARRRPARGRRATRSRDRSSNGIAVSQLALGCVSARSKMCSAGDAGSLVRERRVARPVDLVGERERGGVAPGEVRADRRAWRAGPEDRPVADVAVERIGAAERVVGLGQPPDVVVADGLAVAAADPDLVVERPRWVVPHPQQPVGAELRLGGEVGRAAPAPIWAGKSRTPVSSRSIGVGRGRAGTSGSRPRPTSRPTRRS